MFFLSIFLVLYSAFYFCFGADVTVFHTKQDRDNEILHYIRENYVASFKVVVESENYCPNFDDITIVKNNVCSLPIIFYPYRNETISSKGSCSFMKYLKKNNKTIGYVYNYMEIQHENNTWAITATKRDQKYKVLIIQSSPNFYYNIQMAIKKVIDFVEEEHFHECQTKKKVKRVVFVSKLSSDFVVMSSIYFICIIAFLLGGLSIGIYLLIRHFIHRTSQIKSESLI
uniref:Fgf-3 n=1 Tax=Strongyloides papillosus TaxID=174720 RepID=A0A0N5BXP9_STREA